MKDGSCGNVHTPLMVPGSSHPSLYSEDADISPEPRGLGGVVVQKQLGLHAETVLSLPAHEPAPLGPRIHPSDPGSSMFL